uniref:Threonine dehydratase biosynthetic, chloroplastic n=1 Tax=Cicer arietinum TaxID=3827 RepID=THD1_CICAR|nr:RecName: Full=Threonine dehydratase biosynthetic, chloroplastic; AltName: Full=Threonine deaminase; Short=TD; Flags: Precursor [Cicer arietinum]CAA55313.1 threonine deaminase [Cicer arietinum]
MLSTSTTNSSILPFRSRASSSTFIARPPANFNSIFTTSVRVFPISMSRYCVFPHTWERDHNVPGVPGVLRKVVPAAPIKNKPTCADSDELPEYLRDVLRSPVYDVVVESPVELTERLSDRLGVNFYVKREDRQRVFSFKLRGPYNMMSSLSHEEIDKGVITASAGNHAQGVPFPFPGRRLKCVAKIVMPTTTPNIKLDGVRALGADVVLWGHTFDEAKTHAVELCEKDGLRTIPPFEDPAVIKGQGTIGSEINRQIKRIDAVFVPVGGGGLIAGVAAFFKQIAPQTKIIVVEPYDAASMALSVHAEHRAKLSNVDTFADGATVAVIGEYTFARCQDVVDAMVLVANDGIGAAIKDVFDEGRNIVETSGAAGIAGMYCEMYRIKNDNMVGIVSGANMNFRKLHKVSELAVLGSGHEALLGTYMPGQKGCFKTMAGLVHGSLSFTEITYRFTSHRRSILVLMLKLEPWRYIEKMIEMMKYSGVTVLNISHNELAVIHGKHLVGGSAKVSDEVFVEFIIPEKADLKKFLEVLSPHWNLTLYRYRNQGDLKATILMVIASFLCEIVIRKNQIDDLGYPYEIDQYNDAFNLAVTE